jgi:hypothetical protein
MRRRVVVGKSFDLKATVPEKGAAGAKTKKKEISVVAGHAWELDAKLAPNRVEIIDAIVRSWLAAAVIIVGTTFLAASAILGLVTHSFLAIGAVWAVVGPVYSALAVYYFGPRKNS